jgi:two-component system sensor histidine kinase KdpD
MSYRVITGEKIFPYAASIGLVFITTLVGEIVKRGLEPTNLVALYLLVVVIAAVRWGKGPAVITSVLSVLAFDFFLVPPYLTFGVDDIQYMFTFIGLLAAGLVTSTLASRMREQTIQAHKRETQTTALYRLSADLAESESFETALQAIRRNVGQIINGSVAIYLPMGGALVLKSNDPGFPMSESEKAVAQWAFANARMAGGSSDDAPPRKTRYLPFRTPQGVIGVLGICLRAHKESLTADEESLLNALASQAAVAIQRARLAEEARQLEIMRRTEKLQSALLSSISHDLRTPLVSITGTLTTLHENDPGLDDATRTELLETASEEAARLNRIVGNLLDMTRMEAGTLRISKRPSELRDVLGASLEQLKEQIGQRVIRMNISREFPEIPMDFSFMMKAFYNLLDNAVKYSPHNAPIDINARVNRDRAEIEIRDRGIGIQEGDLKRIFEKFYRAEKPQRVTGTGLGLSISKGIIEAHGGEIVARNNPDTGATFTVTLPLHDRQGVS